MIRQESRINLNIFLLLLFSMTLFSCSSQRRIITDSTESESISIFAIPVIQNNKSSDTVRVMFTSNPDVAVYYYKTDTTETNGNRIDSLLYSDDKRFIAPLIRNSSVDSESEFTNVEVFRELNNFKRRIIHYNYYPDKEDLERLQRRHMVFSIFKILAGATNAGIVASDTPDESKIIASGIFTASVFLFDGLDALLGSPDKIELLNKRIQHWREGMEEADAWLNKAAYTNENKKEIMEFMRDFRLKSSELLDESGKE